MTGLSCPLLMFPQFGRPIGYIVNTHYNRVAYVGPSSCKIAYATVSSARLTVCLPATGMHLTLSLCNAVPVSFTSNAPAAAPTLSMNCGMSQCLAAPAPSVVDFQCKPGFASMSTMSVLSCAADCSAKPSDQSNGKRPLAHKALGEHSQ